MQIQNGAKQKYGQVGLMNNNAQKRRLSGNDWMQQNEAGLTIEGQVSYDPNQRSNHNRSHLS